MQKTVHLSKLSEIELKALKSDIYEDQQLNIQHLQMINNELASRAKKVQEKKNMDETTNDVVVEATEEATETAE